jgi:hypothetical protein
MFGYVRPVRAKLTEKDKEYYGAVYCGLCHALGKRYGFLARLTLTYDFAFLAMLLAPVGCSCEVCRKRCPYHPFRKKKEHMELDALETAADKSVILTWYKLCDDVEDKGFFEGLPSRLLKLFFRRGYKKAVVCQPEFDRVVNEQLSKLHELEKESHPGLDRPADTFACILQASAPQSDKARDRVVGNLLYHVGRWIYLVDAWDDIKEDRKKESYNPMELRFDGDPEAHLEEVKITLTHSLRLAVSACQLENFGMFQGIIENILYFGLPTVQDAVLTGKWHEIRKSKEKNNE